MKTESSQMALAHWQHEIVDLANAAGFAENPDMSVLANAVEYLNLGLLGRLPAEARLLEIGCGVHSLLKNGMAPPRIWEGIDVIDRDRRGKPTIATRIASVQAIPWPAGIFDYVLSNQSIEHWHEYNVSMAEGLSEIHRVLKPNGKAVLNFPIHLHGHRMFVQGRFRQIDEVFTSAGFAIERRTAVIDSSVPQYAGWRLCGFPDFLITGNMRHEDTSYVVEYELRKLTTGGQEMAAPAPRHSRRASTLSRHLHYGFRYLAWKIASRLIPRHQSR